MKPAHLVRAFTTLLIVLSSLSGCGEKTADPSSTVWPEETMECRPWTYWWWMGSAVDKENITANLEDYAASGLGGVHIIPIYGVQGNENNDIQYLSQDWMVMLKHTVSEAHRLGLGVDMTLGTGWPYGGPQVSSEIAASKVVIEPHVLESGTVWEFEFGDSIPLAVAAYGSDGEINDLSDSINPGTATVRWTPPADGWTVYTVGLTGTGQQVKRAAPGGEGNVMDYFSADAMTKYLSRFDEAFSPMGRDTGIRAFYSDSYEVYGANWTKGLFSAFTERRGYDLTRYLPALLGKGDPDQVARVRHDYNETVSDLLLDEFTHPWVLWSHRHGSLTRNQAHGSPGNLLDLYAAADIPETEAFGSSGFPIPGLRVDRDMPEHFGKPDLLVQKFASSAAHVTGRPFVTSESCTWLGEHFKVALSQVKPQIDELFVSGINHVLYHGTAYSPKEAPWPGWLFYASTNFAQSNTFSPHFPYLNKYIARCQSFLQAGEPANDILLYWPVHDTWRKEADEDLLHHFQVHNAIEWLYATPFHDAAHRMWNRGYTFDYLSDRMLMELDTDGGQIVAPGGAYRVIVVPGCRFMPVETLKRLTELVERGATVIFTEGLPEDVPGMPQKDGRAEFQKLLGRLAMKQSGDAFAKKSLGLGSVILGEDLENILTALDIQREAMVDDGVSFVRRRTSWGYDYFLTNLGSGTCDGWVRLGVKASSAILFDPMTGKSGTAQLKKGESDWPQVYVRLVPGGSIILRTLDRGTPDISRWPSLTENGGAIDVTGPWTVTFTEGGPTLPAPVTTDRLQPWTEFEGDGYTSFSGTAVYATTVTIPPDSGDMWRLELGEVRESARVFINGAEAGVCFSLPYNLNIGNLLKPGENKLEIEVVNLPANRIADLDRRGIKWKIFEDINFVSIKYAEFDASGWPVETSGLCGPVKLVPLGEENK